MEQLVKVTKSNLEGKYYGSLMNKNVELGFLGVFWFVFLIC